MTIKSQIEYQCPACQLVWLPFAAGLNCPRCGRIVPDSEVTAILFETLESARFNKRLYGKFDVEYWTARRRGDDYLRWAFKAFELAAQNPATPGEKIALGALMELDLEDLSPYREHVLGYLSAAVNAFRKAVAEQPQDWEKMPEPERPFFGRKVFEGDEGMKV